MTSAFKEQDVLVVGGTGFIGNHLVRRLVQEQASITVLSSTTNTLSINDLHDTIKNIRVDITDQDRVRAALHDYHPWKIFYLATPGMQDATGDMITLMDRVHCKGMLTIAQSVQDYDRFINVGSVDEYGRAKLPFREDTVPVPTNPYAASKAAATAYATMLHHAFQLPIVTVRPFLTYGPRQRVHIDKPRKLIARTIAHVLLGKNFTIGRADDARDFVFVDDIVEGLVRAAITPDIEGETINLASGISTPIHDVVETILKKMGNPITVDYRMPEGATRVRYRGATEKAEKLLGWNAHTSLDAGLSSTIEWYTRQWNENRLEGWIQNN